MKSIVGAFRRRGPRPTIAAIPWPVLGRQMPMEIQMGRVRACTGAANSNAQAGWHERLAVLEDIWWATKAWQKTSQEITVERRNAPTGGEQPEGEFIPHGRS